MVGGMEKLSYALAKEFQRNTDTTLITWGKSQKYLPFVIPYFLVKAIYLIPTKKIDHLHIGDGLLAPLGLLLKIIFGLKTTITIAGLDITFNFPGYQLVVPWCVSKMDKAFCISSATLEECAKRGIPKEKLVVIPCGVYPEDWKVTTTRKDLEKIVGQNLDGTKVLITVGRLVKRKGVYWFIENVMPQLNEKYIYLVIGDGPEKERILELIQTKNLQKRVQLLGKISDKQLKIIYNTADLFVMPNIKVDNNIEGFGIVAIEASSTGLPIVASDMEGISSAVVNGKTGFLVKSMDKNEYIKALDVLNKFDRISVSEITKRNYSWDSIGKLYIKSINSMNSYE